MKNITIEVNERPISLWYDSWYRLKQNKLAMIGMVVLIFVLLIALFGPFFIPFSYDQQNLILGASAPNWQHICGTDLLGRDMLVRIMYGSRVSFAVGICATLVSLSIGITYGAISGYYGGRLDAFMMRVVDIIYALPFTIFAIILMVWLGRNFFLVFVAIGVIQWLTMARIVRGEVLSLKKKEFIDAARALGLPKYKIIFRHIVPNVFGVIIVYATLTVPRVMMVEAFLSFLGFGVQPPMSSLGVLIRNGVFVMEEYPWLLFYPAIVFSLTLFALNFLGDGLRDALDPKMYQK